MNYIKKEWLACLYFESLRLALSYIFAPTFSKFSTARHGYGCHSAFKNIKDNWRGTSWFLRIKISSINLHNTMLSSTSRLQTSMSSKLITKNVLLDLYKMFGHKPTLLSPLFANIQLHQIDILMNLIQNEMAGQKRARFLSQNKYILKRFNPILGENVEEDNLRKRLMLDPKISNIYDFKERNYGRIRYIRYADEILIGIVSNRQFAERLSMRIKSYLENDLLLKAQFKLMHVSSDSIHFLGMKILSVAASKHPRQRSRELEKRKRIRNRVLLRASQREAAWNNKLRKIALSCLAYGLKKTRRQLGSLVMAKESLLEKSNELSNRFVYAHLDSVQRKDLLIEMLNSERKFAEELGWLELPNEIRKLHNKLSQAILKCIRAIES